MTKKDFSDLFQNWLSEYFERSAAKKNYVDLLFRSKGYSLRNGGKRFRPYLAAEVFQIWQQDLTLIRHFCLAIEMIHTYSLIHDDLPCMDNDDFRRGEPSNHKVFQEDIALLAGDALLTESFYLIATERNLPAEVRIRLVELVSEMIGSFGMVGGQVLDMKATSDIKIEQLEQIHQLKTGCLIRAAAVGGAVMAGATEKEVQHIAQFAEHLGMAFQIKDDLLDIRDNEQDFKNYVSIIGLIPAQEQLDLHSQLALERLEYFKNDSTALIRLKELVKENQRRMS